MLSFSITTLKFSIKNVSVISTAIEPGFSLFFSNSSNKNPTNPAWKSWAGETFIDIAIPYGSNNLAFLNTSFTIKLPISIIKPFFSASSIYSWGEILIYLGLFQRINDSKPAIRFSRTSYWGWKYIINSLFSKALTKSSCICLRWLIIFWIVASYLI